VDLRLFRTELDGRFFWPRFDPVTSHNGTLIAGHPVTLTALVDDAADPGGSQNRYRSRG
jgi:hypothetical protein